MFANNNLSIYINLYQIILFFLKLRWTFGNDETFRRNTIDFGERAALARANSESIRTIRRNIAKQCEALLSPFHGAKDCVASFTHSMRKAAMFEFGAVQTRANFADIEKCCKMI